MLADAAPATLLAVEALTVVLTNATAATLLANVAVTAMHTDARPATLLATVRSAAMWAIAMLGYTHTMACSNSGGRCSQSPLHARHRRGSCAGASGGCACDGGDSSGYPILLLRRAWGNGSRARTVATRHRQ